MDDLIFKTVGTDREIEACFSVMAELRPHLKRDEFVKTIHEMERDGYKLAFLSDGIRILAVAGYRVKRMLCCEPFLYVDDLVTTATERSRGYGARFLSWLIEQAAGRDARSFTWIPDCSASMPIASIRRMTWLCRVCIFEWM